jgi:hypothetical protein|tara:strand:+ start:286 stop:474 length:189 start_codon:yes stop_codon:yes gene_type:complete
MLLIAIVAGMMASSTAEFRNVVDLQKIDGYDWEYVGKQQASGVPALPLELDGDKYIYFKLTK